MRAPWRATCLLIAGAWVGFGGLEKAVDWVCGLPWFVFVGVLVLLITVAVWVAIPTMEDD